MLNAQAQLNYSRFDRANHFFDAGKELELGERVAVHHGSDSGTYDSKACFIKAIELDPVPAGYYQRLMFELMLNGNETIAINTAKGRLELNARACGLKVLQADPSSSDVFECLGKTFAPGEHSIDVLLGRKGSTPIRAALTEQDCYLRALELNKNNALAYFGLGKTLPNLTAKIKAPVPGIFPGTKRSFNKIECFTKALALDCRDPSVFYHLGIAMESSGLECVRVGTNSIRVDECYETAYALRAMLPPNEQADVQARFVATMLRIRMH